MSAFVLVFEGEEGRDEIQSEGEKERMTERGRELRFGEREIWERVQDRRERSSRGEKGS